MRRRLGLRLQTVCLLFFPFLSPLRLSFFFLLLLLEPPAGQLRLASAATTNFTSDLLTSAASLFPGALFSTGGDEINKNCYDKDPETQADLSTQTVSGPLRIEIVLTISYFSSTRQDARASS